jgi:hypothetical protein
MMMLYKMEKGLLPNYLCHSLNRVRNSHSHNTRSGDDFILPNFRKNVNSKFSPIQRHENIQQYTTIR